MKISYNDKSYVRSLYSPKQYVQIKNISEIPQHVIKDIKLISLPGSDGIPFGSYVNRVADYFGDIDVIQMVTGCCSIKDVGIKSAKSIQQMVAKIKSRPKHYFSEFKAGIDLSYYFDIGTLSNGVYTMNPRVLEKSIRLYNLNLLSPKELEIIQRIHDKPTKDGNDYDIIHNLFREHYVLRWTEKEVLQGWKMASLGKYKLSDAVLDKSAVKIDMIVINQQGKFIEMTNFMALGLEVNGYFKAINLDLTDITPENLPEAVEELYYSDFYYKPFKLVKRAFAFLKYLHGAWNKKDFDRSKYESRYINLTVINNLLDKYAQVLQSTINILYTVNSELDAMALSIEHKGQKKLDRKWVDQRLDALREPISNVLEIKPDFLDEIMKMIDRVMKMEMTKKVEGIHGLMDVFKKIINFWTIAYFDQLGLNPPPKAVLPVKMSYNPNIIRKPWDSPKNPFAELKGGNFFTNIAKKLFQKLANAYRRNFCDGKARPLYNGEYHFGCHNFTGPGTRVDLKEVREYPPYNDIDACSRGHDFDYMKAVELPEGERQKAIIEADKKVIECYKKFPDQNGAKVSQMGINSKMKLDQVLPIVSKSIFGKISAAKGGVVLPKPKGGRNVKSRSEVTDPRLKLPSDPTTHLRPGEDPEVAKKAFKDAAKLVTSIFREDPKGVVEGLKNIGQHIFEKPKLAPGFKYDDKGRIVSIKYGPNTSIKTGGCAECAGTCGGKKKRITDQPAYNPEKIVWEL